LNEEPRQPGKPIWPSPAYPGLVGNVLPSFLSFWGFPFPERTQKYPHQPFPTLTETYEYLRSFADPFIKSGQIRLNWEVVRVEEGMQNDGQWKVYMRNWNGDANGKECVETWDAVVVAVGWYDNPVWPDTDGLDVIKAKGCAIHAKDWRGPKGLEDKVRYLNS
jgi:cation diffusion facilitator CzcD-associated flavoprotein CzcO